MTTAGGVNRFLSQKELQPSSYPRAEAADFWKYGLLTTLSWKGTEKYLFWVNTPLFSISVRGYTGQYTKEVLPSLQGTDTREERCFQMSWVQRDWVSPSLTMWGIKSLEGAAQGCSWCYAPYCLSSTGAEALPNYTRDEFVLSAVHIAKEGSWQIGVQWSLLCNPHN